MKLSKNFSLREFTKSNTATRLGYDNIPTTEHLENLKALCENILQPLRDLMGQPIRLTSGYRGPELNTAIRGAKGSDHCHGRAADLELWVGGKEENAKLYNAIKSLNLPFYQLIWEFGNDNDPDWVHVAFRGNDEPKRQCLKAYRNEEGKTKYISI